MGTEFIDAAIDRSMASCAIEFACPCEFGPGDRFTLLEGIGIGRSQVYRAIDHRLSEEDAPAEVAIKIRPDGSDLEARRARRVRHPAIVQVYDAGSHGGRAYIVTEIVDGASLDARPWREVFEIAAVIADALTAIHAQGMVHGDVKPANILLDREGSPKLADFEMSVGINRSPRGGTRAFMAPEVAGGSCTPLGDIFALGRTIEQTVSGKMPGYARRIVARAISPTPSDRQQTAAALAGELRRANDRRVRVGRRIAACAAAALVVAFGAREIVVNRTATAIAGQRVAETERRVQGTIQAFASMFVGGRPSAAPEILVYLEWLEDSPVMGDDRGMFSMARRLENLERIAGEHPSQTFVGSLARANIVLCLNKLGRRDEAARVLGEISPDLIPPADPIWRELSGPGMNDR